MQPKICDRTKQGIEMFNNFQDLQSFFVNPLETFSKTSSETTSKIQAINTEATDYAKKSFEKGRSHFEKLTAVKNFEDAVKLQSDFVKSAYEDFVSQSTKFGTLCGDLIKSATPVYESKATKKSSVKETASSYQD